MSSNCLVTNTSICSSTDPGTQLFVQLLNTLLLSQLSLKQQYHPDRSNEYLPSYDFIIVGAGSAGSSLSAKLAANPKWNVLLIEAGTDPEITSTIPFLFGQTQKTDQDWQYRTVPQNNSCLAYRNRECAWPRGKMVGGTSAMNAMIYNMGNPRDYDEWEMLGNHGWSWTDVRKYFASQMTEMLRPEPVDDVENIFTHMRKAILRAGIEMGYPFVDDPWEKSQGTTGVYDVLKNIRNGERVSAARAYLTPLLRQNNFHLIKNGHVTRILIDAATKQTQGVQVRLNDRLVEIRAEKEVILCAGSINTPQILMLSGVGPEKHLRHLGIEPIEDLPVGEHLMDHPSVFVPLILHTNRTDPSPITSDAVYKYFTKRQGVLATTSLANIVAYFDPQDPSNKVGEVSFHFFHIARKEPALPTLPFHFNDELLNQIIDANQHSELLIVLMNLLRPKSEGVIRLNSADPLDVPQIDPRSHSHADDLKVLLGGYRVLQKFVATRAMQAEDMAFLPLRFDECRQQYDEDSDDDIICIIRHLSTTVYHPVGTARMGVRRDDSVVDPRLRVRGIRGLRVADASIMPKIVGGNTNAPCIMIGQKAADLIRDDWSDLNHSEL